MPFAAPVMAERAHVAERAQLASVRRRASETGARTLGEAVGAHLRAHNVDPGSVEWDAWRREDGRWTLTALYDVAGRVGTATFSHDPRGSFVTVDDDDARWLVGDATADATPEGGATTPASDDLAAARQRRLSAVGEDVPLGDDAIEMVTGEESSATPEETTMELSDPVLGVEQPMEAYLDEGQGERDRGEDRDDRPTEPEREPAAEAPAEQKPRTSKKRGRASVPSWDEIMFGGGKGD
jgi:hypothetical protein